MSTATLTRHDRLIKAVHHARGCPSDDDFRIRGVPLAEPVAMQELLSPLVPGRVVVTGTIERRLLVAEHYDNRRWTIADLSGEPLGGRIWPSWMDGHTKIHTPDSWLSNVTLTPEAVHRLIHPRVLLVALYHPEYFPLPRFPLAISDVARAGRATLLGQTRLMDMQLGATVDDIKAVIGEWEPEIIGISATFGQHDLMTEVLDHVTADAKPGGW